MTVWRTVVIVYEIQRLLRQFNILNNAGHGIGPCPLQTLSNEPQMIKSSTSLPPSLHDST